MLLHLADFLITLLVNFFGGIYRARQVKFSFRWFLGVYLPVSFLILNFWIHRTPWPWVIVDMFIFGIGQFIGRRFQEVNLTDQEIEHIEQISDLQLPKLLPQQIHINDEDIAIVLMNMGGPGNIDEVEPFLRRLFNDSLIIRFPFAQSFFADLLIRARLKEVQKRYELIGGGSPLLPSSLKQMEALEKELKKRGRRLGVFLSFNYSDPLPSKTINQIKQSNKKFILPLSLYPHFSLSTTASNIFYLKQAAREASFETTFLESYSYHLYDSYIQAFVERIHACIRPQENLNDFYILFSAHGTPLYFLEEGDPYAFLVSQSVSQILASLKRVHNWSTSYQSAVGPLQWLKPSTDAVLVALSQRGVKKIIVVPISFVTDHIETLCEIDIEYRQMAQNNGIEDFRMAKALECHPGFISALADCVENSLGTKL